MGRQTQVESTKSVCMFCSVDCGIEIITRAGRVVRVEGEWQEHNKGVLCVAGRFEPVYTTRARILTPLIRKNGEVQGATWDEALDLIARRIKAAGPEKVGAWTTCKTLNLTMSEFVAVFRGKVGARVGVLEPTLSDLELPVGGSLNDLLASDCILVTGADPLSTHRVLGYHIKRARMKGAGLILVSNNHNEMARFADRRFSRDELDKAVRIGKAAASARPIRI